MSAQQVQSTSGPHLVALSGNVEGSVHALVGAETSIGRDDSCTVCIPSPRISRRHCVINQNAGHFDVTDLGSLNGIFVNDVPVALCELHSGDRIRIDDTILLFVVPGEKPVAPLGSVTWTDIELGGTGMDLPVERRDPAVTTIDSSRELTPSAIDLESVLRAITELLGLRDVELVTRRALEILLGAILAERGAIILADQTHDEPASVVTMDRTIGIGGVVEVNRSVVRRVASTGVTYVFNDGGAESSGRATVARASSEAVSVLAVPCGPYGVIYLENRCEGFGFDASAARFARTIGSLVGVSVENARRFEDLEAERRRLATDIELTHRMIGESPKMKEVYSQLSRVAQSDASLLILGESGTGKELAARALHLNSARADGPFVAINCAALTETLLESELFGHEKGAFTGAYERKRGKIEIASGGTVFLDEVAELTPALQAKLLRVLQEREFERVGGTRPIAADFRLVSATNTDLRARVSEGRFREDLFFRINVISLRMPSLRERREDIGLLASYFAAQTALKCKRKLAGIAPEAKAALVQYDWPGNVRELQNAIERAVVLGSSPILQVVDLPETVRGGTLPAVTSDVTFHAYVAEAKRRLITKAFDEAGGNYAEAARRLGLNPTYLHRLVRQLDLRPILRSMNE